MKTKVYYDGACYVCHTEISHYRKIDREGRLEFVDISAPDFNAIREGLDPVRVNQMIHVRDTSGSLHLGVDAFIEIWRNIPGYGWAARLARIPVVHGCMKVGYFAFARLRPYLPKRKSCDTGSCAR
jgi:predicted DCC family thiol-disulfide oxidoreductase YuxK